MNIYIDSDGKHIVSEEAKKNPHTMYEMDDEVLKRLESDKSVKNISLYIYNSYTEISQSQDEKWSSSYTTKLKAAGVKNLESVVVGSISQLTDKTVDTISTAIVSGLDDAVLANIQGSTKTARKAYAHHMLSKLITIAAKTEWAESCIIEGKAAINENREPSFPSYPEL